MFDDNVLTNILQMVLDPIGAENIKVASKLCGYMTLVFIPVYGIAVALGKAEIDVFGKAIFIGFYFWLIERYNDITYSLSYFFCEAGLKIGGSDLKPDFLYDPSRTIIEGFAVAFKTLVPANIFQAFDIMDNQFRLIIAIASLVCIFFITLRQFYIVIEYHIVTALAAVLFPFGMLKILRFTSESVISTLFKLNMKLLTFSFVFSLSISIFEDHVIPLMTDNPSIQDSGNCIMLCLIIFLLIWNIPNLSSSIISGHGNLSGAGSIVLTVASKMNRIGGKIIQRVRK